MATNLETLELTISSNAESASKGLTSLINSLTTLSSKLNDAFKNAAKLNVEMEKLGRSKGVRLPSSGSGSRARSTATKAAQGAMQTYKFAPGFAPQPGSIVNIGGQSLKVATPADVANLKGFGEAASTSEKNVGFLSRALAKAKEVGQSATKGFSRVGRIFSTMLIRTAIRSFIKEMSSAWTACYNFSKQMGGSFAQSVDKAKTLLAGTAINIMKTFAPAIQALLPVLTAVASSIQYLCNAIQSLFSLLGMSSGLWGASADSIQKYSKAAGGGSKANKEMLASFDELNVISSESGGGGGGGGGAAYTGFADVISSEFDAITSLLVNEGLIALGLILACTGHIPIGLGLIAIGAAGMVKLLTEDWNKLPNEVKSTITKITAIVGGASLALGAILLLTGNIPLGLGLIALGAGNLAVAIIPNWNSITSGVRLAFDIISKIVSDTWESIKLGASTAWENVKKIWEDSGLGIAVRTAWGGISGFFKGLWADVGQFAYDAWISVSKWWHENVTKNVEKEGIWGGVKGFFTGLWDTVSRAASDAWDLVKIWWNNSGLGKAVTKTWNLLSGALQTVWNTVTRAADDAWNLVKIWWENSGLGEKVRGAWETVRTFFINTLWNPVKTAVTNAWNKVKEWWETSGIGEKVRGVWDTVRSFFINTLWNPVKNAVSNAWNKVKEWWITDVYDKIKGAWDFVAGIFQRAFKPIKDALDWLKELLNLSGKKISATIDVVQNITTKGSTANNTATVVRNQLENQGFFGKVLSGIVGAILPGEAEGAYGIPRGEVFVAQEAGAELVGEINGKTSVANQGQIIEGIASGVERANSEQNTLLRQQNELLRGILEKDASVRIGASAALGRVTRQSLDMYGAMVGG